MGDTRGGGNEGFQGAAASGAAWIARRRGGGNEWFRERPLAAPRGLRGGEAEGTRAFRERPPCVLAHLFAVVTVGDLGHAVLLTHGEQTRGSHGEQTKGGSGRTNASKSEPPPRWKRDALPAGQQLRDPGTNPRRNDTPPPPPLALTVCACAPDWQPTRLLEREVLALARPEAAGCLLRQRRERR